MDSVLFLSACVGLGWLALWSLRDFSKPGKGFWPFDAKWMERPRPAPKGWQRKSPGGGRA